MAVWVKIRGQSRGPLATPPGIVDIETAMGFFHDGDDSERRSVTLWLGGHVLTIFESTDREAYNKILTYMKGRGY
jgi:hypothetical protein